MTSPPSLLAWFRGHGTTRRCVTGMTLRDAKIMHEATASVFVVHTNEYLRMSLAHG